MKKCRVCGHLSEGVRRCPVCQTDVSALPDCDMDTDGMVSEEQYKQCAYGHKNKVDAVKCEKCGVILVNAPVRVGCPERPVLSLSTADGRRILIPGCGGLLGRSYLGETELRCDPYISRKHIKIIPQEAGYVIDCLKSANGAYHNCRELKPGQQAPIKQGDKIRLGVTELFVQLSSTLHSGKRIELL